MKVKAIKKGYYGNKVRKIGEVFDCFEKQIPSWAILVDNIKTQEKKKQAVKTQKDKTEKNTLIKESETQTTLLIDSPLSDIQPADIQKQEYLDLLISEGIEKNILIEDADKKTVDEQIIELETALKKEMICATLQQQ